MFHIRYALLALVLLAVAQSTPVLTAEQTTKGELRIDIPVRLKPSKVVSIWITSRLRAISRSASTT
jgi:hypothetical protein